MGKRRTNAEELPQRFSVGPCHGQSTDSVVSIADREACVSLVYLPHGPTPRVPPRKLRLPETHRDEPAPLRHFDHIDYTTVSDVLGVMLPPSCAPQRGRLEQLLAGASHTPAWSDLALARVSLRLRVLPCDVFRDATRPRVLDEVAHLLVVDCVEVHVDPIEP
jgi:hypothetical protein